MQSKLDKLKVTGDDTASVLEVRNIEGKGKGVFAMNHIPANTCVLAERPLLKLANEVDDETEPTQVIEAFQKLTTPNQEAYLQLYGFAAEIYQTHPEWKALSCKGREVVAIWGANNWNDMVFQIGCRINHACIPNLETSWNERTQRQMWTTLREIEAGEELTGTYIYDIEIHSTSYRREELSKYWGFLCTCTACEADQNVIEGKVEQRD